MISRIVVASMLAASSVSGSAQDARSVSPPGPNADRAEAYWPHMHQCKLDAVSNFTVTNTGEMSTGTQRIVGEITVTRIDLQVTGAPGGNPTISAHAINTKGTGTSGRMSGARSPIGVACVTSQLTGDAAAQKASLASFNYMRGDGQGVGWSCSVSGSEDQPVFSVGLLVPTILGQAESPLGKTSSWSWGVSNNRVSIVQHSAEHSDDWHVACSSKEPRKANYDLAQMKKA